MIYKVTITDKAEADLRGIYEYIAFELLSPMNARGQLDRLQKNIMNLDRFPEKHEIYGKEPWQSMKVRVMPVDNYLVFYKAYMDTGIVTIMRIMYASRQLDKQL